MERLKHLCLDWRVLVGLALVGLGVARLAPQVLGAALPLLVLALCPLSMLLMMGGMARMHDHSGTAAPAPVDQPDPTALTAGEQLRALQEQLVRLQAESAVLAQQIDRLEAAGAGEPAVGPGEASLAVPLGALPRD